MEPETILANSLCTLLGTIPADLLSAFNEQSHRYFFNGCSSAHPCDIVAGQWDDDSEFEYVVINGCGHRTTACQNYAVTLFNRLISTSWKEVAAISIAEDCQTALLRDEALSAAKEGRLKFGGVQYHCLMVGATPQICDYWDKAGD